MANFKEGQEVEVAPYSIYGGWRKAKIDADILGQGLTYQVIFHDGHRGVFDASNIRDYDITRHKGWDGCEEDRTPATD